MQVLAEAFQEKEAEAGRLRSAVQAAQTGQREAEGRLEEARAMEAEVQAALEGAVKEVTHLKVSKCGRGVGKCGETTGRAALVLRRCCGACWSKNLV